MTHYFPGPQQLRFYYTTTPSGLTPMQHLQSISVDADITAGPGQAFSAYDVLARSGAAVAMDTAVDAYVTLLRAAISNAANNTVDYVELWDYEPGTENAAFVSVHAVNLAGTNAGTAGGGVEGILTFRTLGGNSMRLHFEEAGGVTGGNTDTPPIAYAPAQAIVDFVVSTNNWMRARDGTYPFACRAWFPGQNESLFKARFRQL